MKYTQKHGFKKPESTDFYNIDDHNENWDKLDSEMLSCVAHYYSDQFVNADLLIEPLAVIPLDRVGNSGLFNILGSTKAWVWTNFDKERSSANYRTQIAMSYNSIAPKLAFRVYEAGEECWSSWKELMTTDMISSGTADLTAGQSALATGNLHFVYE